MVSWGESPICCRAHCLHVWSSAWNRSNGFPGVGITITLGPVGTVAHPTISARAKNINVLRMFVLMMTSLSALWRTRSRYNFQPAAGTFFHVWIIGFGVRAKIPVTLLFLNLWRLLFNYGRLLLYDNRRRVIIIGGTPPGPPHWAYPNSTSPSAMSKCRRDADKAGKKEYNDRPKNVFCLFHNFIPPVRGSLYIAFNIPYHRHLLKHR